MSQWTQICHFRERLSEEIAAVETWTKALTHYTNSTTGRYNDEATMQSIALLITHAKAAENIVSLIMQAKEIAAK